MSTEKDLPSYMDPAFLRGLTQKRITRRSALQGAGFAGMAFLLTSIHHWFVNPDRNVSLVLIPLGLTTILIGIALLVATTAIYIFGRNRIRTSSEGFSSAP